MKAYQNNPIELYKEKAKLKLQFHKKLCDEYVQLLNTSAYRKNKSKGKYCNFIPEVGGVVSIIDSVSKLGGRLGIIEKLIPSSDGLIRRALVRTTVPSPRININKNLPVVLKEKAICHLIPLELKVDSQLPLSNLNDILSNEESPNPDDITSRIHKQTPSLNTQSNISNEESPISDDTVDWVQNQVLPCSDEPCGLPNCIRPNPAEKALKWVECTNTLCKTWCHYDCAGIPYDKDFTLTEVYNCPLCV